MEGSKALACKICGHTTHVLHDAQFDIDYHQCDYCQFISMDQSHEVSFEEERDIYDTHNNSIENQGYVDYLKNFLEAGVFPFVTKNHRSYFDFGSGPEPVLKQILKRDYGIDGDHYDLHYYPNRAYQNKTYDVITSTEVFEHLKDPLKVIKELLTHVNKEGILSFMTLLHPNDKERFKDWWYRRDETHISFFSEKTIEVLSELLDVSIIYNDHRRVITFQKKTS